MWNWNLLIAITLVASVLLAAWPLIVSRFLRSVVQGICGTLCILFGAGSFFALASGLAGGDVAASAFAEDVAGAVAASVKPATPDKVSSPTSNESQATSLNTLPMDQSDDVVIPPGRPAWVESQPVRTGSTHTTWVTSGPYKKDGDARHALDAELEQATASYIAEVLGSKLAPQFIHYDASQIRAEFVKSGNTYHETIQSPTVGSMEQYHILMEFPRSFQDRIHHDWGQFKAKWRLAQLGLLAGGVILLLSTVFGYFRMDNATRGYYTGRLQFLSAAAILAIVGAGVFLSRWIYWL